MPPTTSSPRSKSSLPILSNSPLTSWLERGERPTPSVASDSSRLRLGAFFSCAPPPDGRAAGGGIISEAAGSRELNEWSSALFRSCRNWSGVLAALLGEAASDEPSSTPTMPLASTGRSADPMDGRGIGNRGVRSSMFASWKRGDISGAPPAGALAAAPRAPIRSASSRSGLEPPFASSASISGVLSGVEGTAAAGVEAFLLLLLLTGSSLRGARSSSRPSPTRWTAL
mmetsp:Transcript_45732/g.147231  ORF Transcript_45732/g.147231 Transcript_45732/m.147231 type:complete len:228 (-) Transcript_45732:1512-2195(-)